ncbi:transmembrane protein 150A [Notolabrus celidotus]|uniref:transmembrane protein 150A n=1 Tax=Notolabrus celidotus TaxID=1203425 RepID=UPI00148F4CCD|nr:transmembrane protein 150A [Notolabrus celidotus]XP_034538091.1 transmembrane protein 150A [Notolabrus celidotus]XP_034538092.1 transmembrane protein 150A [Notolabrus celidotus]XP_034538093.1 transmembrane protein 150A [Notolabrus celidotus]XP_034538095.1 transmembrane protein 150A [Notolabrus celidotus]XP_034538096.1 transmembrane protein 150A [Notolabrus celidotus]XP_034538097.1 transmembrane protein 150A [Notolabrus celidotus]XP_034538098.1 transmembrane protein 150A [Notolabrus celido
MVLWVIFPISLSLVSFIGTWSVYGIAYSNNHVCSLSDWGDDRYCLGNQTNGCCLAPTISSSGTNAPENSLFTATINAGAFLFLMFCIFHHAHIMEKHACHAMLSKIALVFGVVASMGAFGAGNCNPGYLALLHYFGAAVSFMCICFYTVLLTWLTGRCVLTGYEKFLLPYRIISTVIQAIVTICYTFLFTQEEYYYVHLSAVFEWMLSLNLELFELSYAVEFCFFSSYMISNLLTEREEEKPLMMTLS